MCELIHARVMFIVQEKECPADLLDAVCTIMYAAPRTEIKELTELTKLFRSKYGEKFVKTHKENNSSRVSDRIVGWLSTKPPPESDVIEKLAEICKKYKVPFNKKDVKSKPKTTDSADVRSDVVDFYVSLLSDPSTFDMTDKQKEDYLKKKQKGGSKDVSHAAEIAAAIHISKKQLMDQTMQNSVTSGVNTGFIERTLVFKSRPFGMQWTETDDQKICMLVLLK
eukprot:UN24238